MKLELENIYKVYNGVQTLKNISLQVKEGELFSLLGVSGAGKSTILKIIAGLVIPDQGRVLVDGVDITALPTEERAIPYVFQAPLLFPHMTVEENIAFGLQVKRWPKDKIRAKVQDLLQFLRIEEVRKRLPAQLSGGQQQRVAIGRALAPEARLLLMDEPFSSLDYDLRLEMGNLLKEIQKEWKQTIVFVTHDRQEGMVLADQMGLLINGKIEQIGKPSEIYYEPLSSELALFMGQGNFISGFIRQGNFQSSLGDLPALGEADGEAQLFIRPHQVRINPLGREFTVLAIKVAGRERCITLGNEQLEILVETFADDSLGLGSPVGIHLPQGKLHFIRDK